MESFGLLVSSSKESSEAAAMQGSGFSFSAIFYAVTTRASGFGSRFSGERRSAQVHLCFGSADRSSLAFARAGE
jgi:hypothetical protein